jgi:anti-anti-sigma regulatory factor
LLRLFVLIPHDLDDLEAQPRTIANLMSTALTTSERILAAPSIASLLSNGAYERHPVVGRDTLIGRASITREEVVLDCGEIVALNSEDLNQLIRFQTELRHEAATLVLTNVPDHLVDIFTMTRLNRLFEVRQ